MRKLARTDEPEPKVAPKTQQPKKVPIEQPAPSRCVLLKNMYNQAELVAPHAIITPYHATDTLTGKPSPAGKRSSKTTYAANAKTSTATWCT